MKIAVYHLAGDEVSNAEIKEMISEMDERGLFDGTPDTLATFTDPDLSIRDGLLDATRWGDALLLPRMKGRGRIRPFLDFLAKSGLPLFVPQIPTFPHGKPLDWDGYREIFAWNDRMKSLAFRDRGAPGPGGDTGYRPPPGSTERARQAKSEAAQEIAEERAPEVVEAYITHGSFNAAANHLNKLGHPTPSGSGKWYSSTVKRLLKKVGAL